MPSSLSSQFLCDLKVTASLNYSSLQVFFPALAAGESMLTDEERSSFDPLRIPDTVLYNYGKPIERYGNDTTVMFGSKKRGGANASAAGGGRVTRLSGRLTTEGIWDDFSLSQCPTTRRSAMWMEEASESTAALSQMRDVLVDVQCQEPDQSNLRLFLQRIKGKGMLQQVVETKRESDGSARCVMFLCHYSQHRFSVDKLTSLYLIAGTGGAETAPPPSLIFSPHFGSYHVSVVPASRTFTQLRRHSDRVALCLSRVYKAHVAAMTLVFRFGADESLYLSWCDSVSLCQMSVAIAVPIGGGGGGSSDKNSDVKLDSGNGSSSSSGSGGGNVKGPITYAIDAHGSRVASSSPPKHAARGTKFALSDPRDEMFECTVCRTSYRRGELGRVQLRWLLMALSIMDPHVKGWHGEVPPSVALVCPDITVSGFRRLQEVIETEPMFRLICTDCSSRAEASIQRMTNSKIRAPAWLGVDKITVGRKASALRKAIRVQHTTEEDVDSRRTFSVKRHNNNRPYYTVIAFSPRNEASRETVASRTSAEMSADEVPVCARASSSATTTRPSVTLKSDTDLGNVNRRMHDDDHAVAKASVVNISEKETRATCEGPAAVHIPLELLPHDALPLYKHQEGMWRPIKRGKSKYLVRPTLFGGQSKIRNGRGECDNEEKILGFVVIDEDMTDTEFRELLADKLSTLAAASTKDEGNGTADERERMDGTRHLRDNDIATFTPCSTPLQQKDLVDGVVFLNERAAP